MDLGVVTVEDNEYISSWGTTPATVSSLNELLQTIVIELKSTYDPITGLGSGLPSISGFAKDDSIIRQACAECVKRAEQHVKANHTSRYAAGRLVSLKLLNVEVDSQGSISVQTQVETELGVTTLGTTT